MKLNPVAETVRANGGSEMASKVQPLFKAKKASVIPPKRKLVKRMMFDLLVQFLASLCSSGAAYNPNNTTMTDAQECNDPFS